MNNELKNLIVCCMISLTLAMLTLSIRIEKSIKDLETKIDKYYVTEEE